MPAKQRLRQQIISRVLNMPANTSRYQFTILACNFTTYQSMLTWRPIGPMPLLNNKFI